MTTTFPDCDHGNILKMLAGYGVIDAKIEFNGGGDSGAIDNIEATLVSKETDLTKVPVSDEHAADWGLRPRGQHNADDRNLYGLLEQIGDMLLQETGQDWYNNDGGGGTIEIVPGTGRLFVDMHYYVQSEEPCPVDFSVEVLDDGVPVVDPDPKTNRPQEVA